MPKITLKLSSMPKPDGDGPTPLHPLRKGYRFAHQEDEDGPVDTLFVPPNGSLECSEKAARYVESLGIKGLTVSGLPKAG